MKRVAVAVTLSLASLASSGCAANDSLDIGRFEVVATRQASCADTGVLGAAPAMEMFVFLRRIGAGSVSWSSRHETLFGDLDTAGHFEVTQAIQSHVSTDPNCHIRRDFTIEGELEGDPTSGYEAFTGSMSMDYEALAGSQCGELEAPELLGGPLPCTTTYALAGTRQ